MRKFFLIILGCITLISLQSPCSQTSEIRIVSLAPSITEMIDDLGMAKHLIGITTYCKLPEEADQAVVIGSLTSPSIEKIVSLQPGVIFADRESNRETVLQRFESAGFRLVRLGPIQNYEDIVQSFMTIARTLEIESKAQEMVQQVNQRLQEIRELIENQPKPKVFIEIWHKPLKTVSAKGFIHSIFEQAGAQNVFADSPVAYPNISMESVIAQKPDYIAILTHSLIDEDRVRQYQHFPVTSEAVIRQFDAAEITQPTLIHYVESVEILARWLHPTVMSSSPEAEAED
ncbi:MAG: ABC transporter substrate-binding protein [bacterium]|jgi:ABC-type Fe3+-hydroxamate transport system substrate-binding protein